MSYPGIWCKYRPLSMVRGMVYMNRWPRSKHHYLTPHPLSIMGSRTDCLIIRRGQGLQADQM